MVLDVTTGSCCKEETDNCLNTLLTTKESNRLNVLVYTFLWETLEQTRLVPHILPKGMFSQALFRKRVNSQCLTINQFVLDTRMCSNVC